ncbi:hypothetical protein [Paraflavitalea speifideaquila]|uniref:hypothetical protein n=1 Tax=Paraflavitalea speifideaquila TaxID=3076558 RepID=UPI0028E71567|nr:hypothetical protein [Paraflavitalea speifideiaquila]
MKLKYYVNNEAQSNGDHEVHIESCPYFPRMKNKRYLGEYDSCVEAVRAAKYIHHQANGCKTCCSLCHTT